MDRCDAQAVPCGFDERFEVREVFWVPVHLVAEVARSGACVIVLSDVVICEERLFGLEWRDLRQNMEVRHVEVGECCATGDPAIRSVYRRMHAFFVTYAVMLRPQ